MNRRNIPCLDNVEIVRGDLLACLSECRTMGMNTVSGLDRIAKAWGVASRRVVTLMYRNQSITIEPEERTQLAWRAVRLLDHIADQFGEYQERARGKADAIRHREQQLELPLGGDGKCRKTARKYAA